MVLCSADPGTHQDCKEKDWYNKSILDNDNDPDNSVQMPPIGELEEEGGGWEGRGAEAEGGCIGCKLQAASGSYSGTAVQSTESIRHQNVIR